MKKILGAALFLTSFSLLSCNGNKNNNDSTTDTTNATVSADTGNSAMNNSSGTQSKMNSDTNMSTSSGKTVTDKDVVEFVKKASSGGMMEVEMGKMAGDNAQSQRVKDFGAMLVTDHTNAGNELKSMATGNDIPVPTDMMPAHKTNMGMMMKMKGAGFDKAYIDMMIKDHQEDIADYKKASTDLSDASYKAYASKTLPVLQKHLDSAMAIRKGIK